MDQFLRCNSLKCRAPLTEKAAVTTCSHIFCVSCSEFLQPSTRNGQRSCPACQTALNNPDDAILSNLRPTEDYKTSVLSGLDPSTIMECAGRALEFWSYQTLQERVYQEHLAKSVSEENKLLNTDLDRMVHDANTEFALIQDKLSTLQIEHETLQRKNHDLVEAYREKSRKCSKTQELYDRLKKRTLLSQLQGNATTTANPNYRRSPISDTMADVPESYSNMPPGDDRNVETQRPSPLMGQPSAGYPQQNLAPRQTNVQANMGSHNRHQGGNSWEDGKGYGTLTTSQNRQRIPMPNTQQSMYRQVQPLAFPTHLSHQPIVPNVNEHSRARQPLGDINPNAADSNFGGYGLNSGIKVGRSLNEGDGRFISRPRVAQRQGPVGGAPSNNSARNGFMR